MANVLFRFRSGGIQRVDQCLRIISFDGWTVRQHVLSRADSQAPVDHRVTHVSNLLTPTLCQGGHHAIDSLAGGQSPSRSKLVSQDDKDQWVALPINNGAGQR